MSGLLDGAQQDYSVAGAANVTAELVAYLEQLIEHAIVNGQLFIVADRREYGARVLHTSFVDEDAIEQALQRWNTTETALEFLRSALAQQQNGSVFQVRRQGGGDA